MRIFGIVFAICSLFTRVNLISNGLHCMWHVDTLDIWRLTQLSVVKINCVDIFWPSSVYFCVQTRRFIGRHSLHFGAMAVTIVSIYEYTVVVEISRVAHFSITSSLLH